LELFEKIRQKMKRELKKGGAHIDAEYYCFHHPAAKLAKYRVRCRCRKPKPGMILRAMDKYNIDQKTREMIFAGNILRQPAFTENDICYRVIDSLANTDKICMDTFWIGLWPGISERQIRCMLDAFASFSKTIQRER
jgi:dTDP-4-amino-4,6-dideoxygalactose transaminase